MGSVRDLEFFARLAQSRSVLVAGAGGGFDVYAGLPIALALMAHGKRVHLANCTETVFEVSAIIEAFRHQVTTRPRRAVPH